MVRALVVASCAAMLTLIGATPASAFMGPWLPAFDVSATGQSASRPKVVVAPDGTTSVAWSSGVLQAATRPPGGVFSLPVDISPPGEVVSEPYLASAPDGTVVAVWQRTVGADTVIRASTRQPGGAFGVPIDVSSSSGKALNPQIAIALDGT